MKYSIGVDIGATNIRMGIVGEDGSFLRVLKEKTTTVKTPDALIGQLLHLYNAITIEPVKLTGIGIGIPGPVLPGTGFVYVFPNLQLPPFDIAKALSDKIKLPIYVSNDANVAAFGEAKIGAGKGYDVVQFFVVSTGIGGGLIVNGKIWTGRLGFAQEVGNMIINPNGVRPNPTMNVGSWESFCSGTSLVRMAAEAGVVTKHAGEVFTNPKLSGLVDEWINNMAIAIANMVTLYEPDIFVIGGGVIQSKDYFLERMRKKVNDYVFKDLENKIMIVPALLDQDAGLIGAALLAF